MRHGHIAGNLRNFAGKGKAFVERNFLRRRLKGRARRLFFVVEKFLQKTLTVYALSKNFFHALDGATVPADLHSLFCQIAVLRDKQDVIFHAVLCEHVQKNIVGKSPVVAVAQNVDELGISQAHDVVESFKRRLSKIWIVGIFLSAISGIFRQLLELLTNTKRHD